MVVKIKVIPVCLFSEKEMSNFTYEQRIKFMLKYVNIYNVCNIHESICLINIKEHSIYRNKIEKIFIFDINCIQYKKNSLDVPF